MSSYLVRGLAILGCAAALGACATKVPGADERAPTPTQRFSAAVKADPEELRLAVHAQGLSQRQAEALERFVAYWQDDEGGIIGIQTPQTGVDSAAAFRMTEAARGFLLSRGVPAEKIEVVSFRPATPAAANLVVGYMRYRAELPKCGSTWTNVTRSSGNHVSGNFGCSVTANIAAQMADPGDLLGPRTSTPQDATRRQDVLDKYRKGEVTSAAKDEQADGAVSRAVN